MSVKEEAVKRAVKMLEAAGAEFHIKLGSSEWGASLCTPRSAKVIKNRGISNYIRSYLENIQISDVIHIPTTEDFDINTVQSASSLFMLSHFGKGSSVTSRSGNCVEVLRVQ